MLGISASTSMISYSRSRKMRKGGRRYRRLSGEERKDGLLVDLGMGLRGDLGQLVSAF